MASVVASLKAALEDRGEHVVLANVSSGWFAVNPRTWKRRSERAQRDGRAGPKLIVYSTKSGDPRDHFVIPFSIAQDLLTQETLKTQSNGSDRWNLTLKNGLLHVTHRSGAVDVSDFFGGRLIVEDSDDERVAWLTQVDGITVAGAIVEGISRESRLILKSRSRTLREAAMKRSRGVCEACAIDFSMVLGGRGLRTLQVHHKRQLALEDEPVATKLEDLAVVCANCHSMIHADSRSAMPLDLIQRLWEDTRTVERPPPR